jgi:hypothetical protein
MTFEFSHDGHTYRLHTEAGQAQCDQVDTDPAEAPAPLEPSEEPVDE